jgi:hypothetical protein
MIYTFVSSGTDNGKQFHTSEEALAYLHQVVEHSKTHLDGKLIDMTCTETELAIKYKEINRKASAVKTGTKFNHQNIRIYGIRIHSSKRN